jgi:LPS-assembly lipoprotein
MSWSEAARAQPPLRRGLLARRRGLGACLAALVLPGCGFTLRLPPRLNFRSLAMTGFEPRSPLAEDLRRHLGTQVQLLEDPGRAEVVLHSLADQRTRSVVASTAAAQVRELQLRVRFEFRALAIDGRELIPRVQLLLARDMSYSETFALAKEQEEAELFRDMQSDVVAQVLRRLASIKI